MATFTNTWDETIPLDDSLTGLSEAGKIDVLIRQMKLDIRERILKFMPVGMVVKWPCPVVPHGFKECNGESLLRSQYPDLFSVIGTVYGAANSSHFNIPTMSGKYCRGWNNSKSTGIYDPDAASRTATTKPGATMPSGDHVGTDQDDENKSHAHDYYSVVMITGAVNGISLSLWCDEESGTTPSVGTENRPVSIYFKYIIRVDDEHSDGSYNYIRTWDEGIPVESDQMGRMAREIRKLRVDVQELLNNLFPPGLVIYWPSPVVPDGYIECNGQAIDRAVYSDLYNQIEDIYGDGDGETTFNVPDCRGLFIRCDDGANLSVVIDDDIKAHDHTFLDQTDGHGYGLAKISEYFGEASITVWKDDSETEDDPIRTVDSHPKNIYLMAIVKAVACV